MRGSRAVCCAGFVAGSFHRPAGGSDCRDCLWLRQSISRFFPALPHRYVLLRLRPKNIEIESFKDLMSELWYPNAGALVN